MRKKILNKTKKFLAVLLITIMMSSVTVYGSTKATTPMKGWRYAKKTASYQVNSTSKKYDYTEAQIKNVGVKYDTKKIFITGKAKGCKYVTGKYNGKEKTVKVESNKFKLVFDYTKAKDIKISGLNSKKERISRNKKVNVEKYVTEKPIYDKIKRTGKGIKYGVKTVANSTLSFKYKGKLIKKCVIDSSYTNITIKDSILKGKSGYFTVTQKENGKKISKKMKFPILKEGEVSEISY